MDAPKVSGEQVAALMHAVGKTHRKFRDVAAGYAGIEDFKQELALRILKRFRDGVVPGSVECYAQAAATNMAAQLWKRQRRREEERNVSFVEVNQGAPRLTREPIDDLIDREHAVLVAQHVVELQPIYRDAVQSYYFGAPRAGMSAMQKQRLHRARAQLAETLGPKIGACSGA